MEKKRAQTNNPRIHTVYHKFLPFFFFFLITFVFFFRLFYPRLSLFMIPDFGASDVVHLNLPLKEILSASLKNNTWPLWTPLLASGFPILAEGQIGTFYLPNLFLFRFFPTVLAYNINLILAFLLSGLGCLLLGRRLTLSPFSSLFFALVFTFSGFFAVHLNHFNLIQAASLLPILFWACIRLWKTANFPSSLLFALILTEQIFTGHFYIVFITLLGIFLFFLILTFQEEKEKRVKILKKTGGALFFSLILTILLSAIQLFPTSELWRLSTRSAGLSFDSVTSFPYPFKHLLGFLSPYIFGSPAKGTYPPFSSEWGIFWENTAYIGIVPLLFSFLALFFWREKLVKTGFILFVVSLFLVLGKNSPFYFVFSFFPFTLFRVPSKFLLLTTFALTLLATFFFARIQGKKVFLSLSFLFFFIDLFRFSYNYPPITPASFWTNTPPSAAFLQNKDGRIATIGATTLWNDTFLTSGWQDIKPYAYFQNSLYPNLNVLFGIPQIRINTGGLIPRRVSLFTALTSGVEIDEKEKTASISSITKNSFSLGNVKYIISPYTISDPSFTLVNKIVPSDDLPLSPFLIYENKDVLPRIYIAFKGKKVDTLESFYRQLNSTEFIDNKEVLLEEENSLTSGQTTKDEEGSARITGGSATDMSITTSSSKDGLLVVTDTYYPGWKAYVDGKETPIIMVNLTQRGIMLPKGNHLVRLSFYSQTFETGKIITVSTLIITSVAMFLSRVYYLQRVSGTKTLFRDPSDKSRRRGN